MAKMGELIADSRYSPNVRVGNWFENLRLEEDEIQEFIDKREKGELVLQKTRKLFSNFFKEVTLPYIRKLKFGTIVQLIPSRMKICDKFEKYKPALSIVVNEGLINKSQQISERCELTIAPSLKPCVRNTFIIISGDKKDRTGEILAYGQDFILQCVEAEEQPLVLFSAPKSADLTNVAARTYSCVDEKGEETLPLGLCLLTKTGSANSIPLGHCRWRCFHQNPNQRFETEGQSIVTNTELVIMHSATNRSLAAHNMQISTLFGPECLVSVHSYLDAHKKEKWPNYWMFGTSTESKK